MKAERFWDQARSRTHLIVGLSERTGIPAARALQQRGVPFRVSDDRPRDTLADALASLSLPEEAIHCGPQTPRQLEGVDALLIAPGVPRTIPLLRAAEAQGLPVWMDMDFLHPLLEDRKIVGITGTDGKTTTTTLIGHLLEPLGNVVVGGNIGQSVWSLLDEIADADWVVLELSSFMLDVVHRFRSDYAVVLNIGEDHIERYDDLTHYARAKMNIVAHARPTDHLVVFDDDPMLSPWRPNVRRLPFSRHQHDGEAFVVGDLRIADTEVALRGVQNVPNILAALRVACAAGVPEAHIRNTLRTFRGLPHRLEHVGCFGGVDAYNDSKASNVHAVTAALRNFEDGVVLILGGRDKGLDFSILKPHAHRLRCLVCYGEDGEKIRDAVGFEPSLYTYRFDDAVALAAAQCVAGDALVMSPGCTSWDQFDWYGERGDAFRVLAREHLRERERNTT